jgi:hypothetical protein
MPAPSLSRVLVDVRERIAIAGSRGLNEQNTKATLIEPILRALGWDTEDVDEVRREYRLRTQDKPVDYGLLAHREPRLLVEAKGLGEPLADRRWANQIMGYSAVMGVQWIVLTDGDQYQGCNAGKISGDAARAMVEGRLLGAGPDRWGVVVPRGRRDLGRLPGGVMLRPSSGSPRVVCGRSSLSSNRISASERGSLALKVPTIRTPRRPSLSRCRGFACK